MRSLVARAAAISSLIVLPACTGGGEGSLPGTRPEAPAHAKVGSFAMRVRPSRGTVEIRRVPEEVASAPGLYPQNFDNLPIVSDGNTGTGPDYTVELATDPNSLIDTYMQGASGNCPAGSFCGDVTFTHFYPGLDLSAVYVQVTAVTDASGNPLANHDVNNGVASTPFGIDLTYGAWQYPPLPGTVAKGVGVKKTWSFNNPDDADFVVYLNAMAALYPMLWFGGSGVTQTAPLVAGQPAIVHYEYARNGSCRGSGWSMNGFLKGNNIDMHEASFPGNAGDTYFDIHMVMPFGPGVDLWFNNTDGSGCQSWDSNNGNNFNYGVADSNTGIHFAGPNSNQTPYWSTAWQVYPPTVTAGATITVDYELDRVLCGSLDRYGRVPAGTQVTMYYHYGPDLTGTYTPVNLLGTPYDVPSSINGSAGQVFVPPSITLPSTSTTLWIYFDSTDGSGCHKYDSNGGLNWSFGI